MRLRRLEIVGFKSFANKSTFILDGDVTVLAGPNGSGKSNVAEAVRWVLGEQRPSALRSRRADEVIFLGSATRAPIGMAEVSLIMDNAEGRMGVDFGEVRITRRIYRSGESDYLLNGRKVRLRDITERLLAVGLGPDTYTVIGQGAVDEMIAQKPEERRVALENAADVRRHQIQLNETRSRLATTEENLTRCRDVLAELEPQVRRMRSHADRAARAREVRQALQKVTRQLYRHQYRAARERRVAAEARAAQALEALGVVERELGGLEERWRALEQESESLGQHLTAADQRVRELRRVRDEIQRRLLETREAELQLESETRAVQERQERMLHEREEAQRRLDGLVSRASEAEQLRDAARAAQASLSEEERSRSAAARTRRDALVAASTQLMQLRAQVDRERHVQETSAQKATGLRAAHEGVAEEMARLDETVRVAEVGAHAASEAAASEQGALELHESELSETDKSIAQLDRELQQSRANLRTIEQEYARLEAARASLDESLKRLVSDAAGSTLRRASAGVLGVFGPSLRVAEGYERVISAALADRVGSVVIHGVDEAGELARRVNEADERASLVLAEFNDEHVTASIEELRSAVRTLSLDGIAVTFASDHVECETSFRPVMLRYLGHTMLVDSAAMARALAASVAQLPVARLPWQIVTRDGHVLRWNGEWRAGSDQRQVRLLAGRTELEEIQRQLEQQQARLSADRARLTDLERELQLHQERRSQLRSQAQAARSAYTRAASEVERLRRQLVQAQQARAAFDARHAAATEQLRALEEQATAARARVEELTARIAEQDAERAQAQADVQRDDEEISALRQCVAAAQRDLAEADARLNAVQGERRRDERLQSEIDERIGALASVNAGLEARRIQLLESTSQERMRLERTDADLPEADRRLESLLGTMNQLAARRGTLDAQLGEVRGRVRQAQTVHDAAAAERDRTLDDMARLEREIADELEDLGEEGSLQITLGLDSGPGEADVAQDGDPAELQREVRSLKRELARLGPVDDSAVSEYQELIDRYEFLTQQSGDLERASDSLRSAMADLEVLIQDGMEKTLTEVNQAFQRTFERLFQGGEARLVWSVPENPVGSGVEIVAQPPGKRLQPLGQFSGGERALASVALVFALLQVNPTPFCVLDEVDAALDESNVGRFAEIIREWSQRTQFIVVTHNRNTMEIADALFGISMDTHGVSRVVSLRLDEALAAAER